MGNLQGRSAIVTGSARGIGAGIAKRLASDGAKVAVIDLNQEACLETVREIEAQGGTAIALGCDVSNADQVQTAVAKVAEEFDGVDILVNNAGITRDNLLFKMTEDDWDMVMNVHLKGSFLCSRAAQKYMVEKKYGKIVNLSSVSALGNRGQANYSAAKAGLQGFTRTLAIELGPFNINVNAVAPGFIDTEMTRQTALRMGLDPEDFKKGAAARIPLRRVGVPADIANVIAFLVSDDASYVSGQIIYVNGGER
ncbi:beta-ketoacyl-ACP reductase [Alicyclobacillus tolerans]|uniref:beta-ketoacyl-ACP reductase n=1 Tax=Alicyclobacillus tolerans TaxID=90970 RepID=UPI001F2139C0|nr:beta-ketoacyl-ACP reductase [Alicyclobacillus tolerans]MCF8565223.1 beta-ketoacyl-ACP reductase [Alicyclobacillus tolerans]